MREMGLAVPPGHLVSTIEANAPPRHYNTFTLADRALLVADRQEFNRALWVQALLAGVPILHRRVLRLSWKQGVFRAQTDRETFTGDALIGADGAASLARRAFGGKVHENARAVMHACVPSARYAGRLVFDGRPSPPGYGWVFPTGPETVNAGVYATHGKTGHRLKDLLGEYVRARVENAPESPVTGGPIPWGGARLPENAPPVLLVGDAGAWADPMTGEGIFQALFTGRAAAMACIETPHPAGARRAFARRTRLLALNLAFLRSFCPLAYPHVGGAARVLATPFMRRVVTEGLVRGYTSSQCMARFPALYFASFSNPALVRHEHRTGLPLAERAAALDPALPPLPEREASHGNP
jgi:hypothetical protein